MLQYKIYVFPLKKRHQTPLGMTELRSQKSPTFAPGLSGTMLTINPGGFPKAEKEIAVPTLVMELKEALEALKPKPKEQALEDEMWMCRMWMWMDASGLDSKIWNGHYFKLATLVFDVFFLLLLSSLVCLWTCIYCNPWDGRKEVYNPTCPAFISDVEEISR